jgi:hypothetical protein
MSVRTQYKYLTVRTLGELLGVLETQYGFTTPVTQPRSFS